MERKPFEQRLSALIQESQSWESQWKDLATYIQPTRGFFDETPNWGAAPDYKKLIDGSSVRAVGVLAAGMHSGLTSPSRPWFRLGTPDSDLMKFQPVKEYLGFAQNRMLDVFAKSNIYGVLFSIYEEVGAFGTGCAILLEDFQTVIRGRNFTVGEYQIATGPDGRVNGYGRKYWMTVSQLVSDFGLENCSESVKNMWAKGEADKFFKVCHLIEENNDRIPGKEDFRNMPWRSVYWEESSPQDTFLRVHGFPDFPILAPRWGTTTTADVYGKGPGWFALGDIKMLQKMQLDKLLALDKLVNPPMQQDGTVQGEVNTLPGGVTFSSAQHPNAGVRPAYQINPDIQALEFSIEKTQGQISKAFYADLFLMLAQSDRRQITAREVVERHEEKLLMLGPVLERLQSELLGPLIDRTFSIMLRNGLLPPPPRELQGMDLKVEYISMLAQAQKMVGTTSIEQMAAFAGNLAAVSPGVLDVIDLDEGLHEYGEMLGVPPKMLRSRELVAQIRADRAKQQQAAMAAQNMGQMVQGAKVLSETPVGENSALDAIMGTTGQAQQQGGNL